MNHVTSLNLAKTLNLPLIFPCRLVGRPGSYLYVFESYRMEEVGSLFDRLSAQPFVNTVAFSEVFLTGYKYLCYYIIYLTVYVISVWWVLRLWVPSQSCLLWWWLWLCWTLVLDCVTVCPRRLSDGAVHPAEHHHVGKAADSEQPFWDWNTVSVHLFASIHYPSITLPT